MYSNLQKCWKVTHVIIGPQSSGKSLFFEHLKNDPLNDDDDSGLSAKRIKTQQSKFSNGYNNRGQTTVGMDFGIRHTHIDGEPVTLQLYDTAGQDKYETITNSYFKKADIIWIIVDLTDEERIESLESYWIPHVYEYATKPHVQAILIGNKKDLIEQVLSNEVNDYRGIKEKYKNIIQPKIQRLISKYKLPYFEVSAKNGNNVMDTFMLCTTALMRNIFQKYAKNNQQKKNKRKGKKKQASDRYQRAREESLDTHDCDFSNNQKHSSQKGGCCCCIM